MNDPIDIGLIVLAVICGIGFLLVGWLYWASRKDKQ